MPPAFNLSQDQTLQFDLFTRTQNSLDLPPRPLTRTKRITIGTRIWVNPAPTALASCEHEALAAPGTPRARLKPHPQAPRRPRLSTHTYRLLIVKERLRYMGSRSFASSDRLPCHAIARGEKCVQRRKRLYDFGLRSASSTQRNRGTAPASFPSPLGDFLHRNEKTRQLSADGDKYAHFKCHRRTS